MALKGISGSLASLDLLEALACPEPSRGGEARLRTVLAEARRTLGPASSARQIADVLVFPLARELGLESEAPRDEGDVVSVPLSIGGRSVAVLSFLALSLLVSAYLSLGGKPLFGKALLDD